MFHVMKIIAILSLAQVNAAISSTQLHENAAVDTALHLRGLSDAMDTVSVRILKNSTTTNNTNKPGNAFTSGKLCMCVTPPCACNPTETPLFKEKNVTKCPVIGPAWDCAIEIKPVVCGKLGCYYDNACTAAGAGWNVDAQCSPDPNAVRAGKNGTKTGTTTVKNSTKVVTTGKNGTKVSTTGQKVTKPVNKTIANGGPIVFVKNCLCPKDKPNCKCPGECPRLTNASVCTPTKQSYECGPNDCVYASRCEARRSGWNVTKDCVSTALTTSGACKVPPSNNTCPDKMQEVKCGSKGCLYDNRCLATSAGWTLKQCNFTNPVEGEIMCKCPASDPHCCKKVTGTTTSTTKKNTTSVKTTTSTGTTPKKVTNTTTTAKKTNTASTTVKSQVNSMAVPDDSTRKDTTPPPSCPIFNGMCTMEYSPRVCSQDPYKDCTYSNACIAAGAGFDVEKNCVMGPME
jgi:hypothetical protein